MKTLIQLQKQLDEIAQKYEKPYWEPMACLGALIEEVGEVARILNHKYGDKPKKPGEQHEQLSKELADVIVSVFYIANREGIVLDQPVQASISKLETRDKDRF